LQAIYNTKAQKLLILWLEQEKLSIYEFCYAVLKKKRYHVVHDWVTGKTRPTLDAAIHLQQVTKGFVPCEAWELIASQNTKQQSTKKKTPTQKVKQ